VAVAEAVSMVLVVERTTPKG
jgi:ribonuclease HI